MCVYGSTKVGRVTVGGGSSLSKRIDSPHLDIIKMRDRLIHIIYSRFSHICAA